MKLSVSTSYRFAAFAAAVLFAFSCSDNDTERPEIEIESPAFQQVFQVGDTLLIQALITDNEALRQYKIDVHNNADGHGHKGMAGLPKWDTILIRDIEGPTYTLVEKFRIPAGIWTGEYHVTIFALDESGNQGFLNREFFIVDLEDTVAPTVSITQPAANASLANPFTVAANIADLKSDGSVGELAFIRLRLVSVANQSQTFPIATLRATEDWSGSFQTSTGALSGQWNRPAGAGSGAYWLEIRAEDAFGNRRTEKVQVNIP